MKALSWFSVLVFTLAAHSGPAPQAGAADMTQSWLEDYARIQGEITQYQTNPLSESSLEHVMPMMDKQARILRSDRDVLDVQLRRMQALLTHLKSMPGAPDLQNEQAELNRLKQQSASAKLASSHASSNRQALFMESRGLARRVAFQNPLLDFDDIIFNTFEHQIQKK
jgi:hypothetical protein